MTPTRAIGPAALRELIIAGGELALLDPREGGVFAGGHLLFAVSMPLSRLEFRIDGLVPRRDVAIVLCADAGDHEARGKMMFAATLAGIAFGNSGCHLPHGMSYSVSGLVRDFQPAGYPDGAPIVPHGMSVIVNAPSVFRFTAQACPERHLRAAECLGGDTAGASLDDAGEVVAKRLIELMKATGIPNGVSGVGYGEADIAALTEGSFPQKRLLENAPLEVSRETLAGLYKGALSYW